MKNWISLGLALSLTTLTGYTLFIMGPTATITAALIISHLAALATGAGLTLAGIYIQQSTEQSRFRDNAIENQRIIQQQFATEQQRNKTDEARYRAAIAQAQAENALTPGQKTEIAATVAPVDVQDFTGYWADDR